ncbi:MAG: leucine-rich repeat domain-containing protein [Oscillospiraceae bacterium]|nr:leucine-rich repeat domain-containing protein [Oscillospiraceae bacterium]
MNYLRKSKGITLIAIVIIIVLVLVLAGGAIYAINSSLLSKNTYKNNLNKQLTIQVSSNIIDNQSINNNSTQFSLKANEDMGFDYNSLLNADGSIAFEDANFEKGIKLQLQITTNEIFPKDVETITDLNVSGGDIKSLNGIQYFKELKSLTLDRAHLTNIEPLKYLANLETLELNDNGIVDISPLSGLKALTSLCLGNNLIKDITPLGQLVNIRYLNLSGNRITDISVINNISDSLAFPIFLDNPIMDYSPIINNFDKIFNNSGFNQNIAEYYINMYNDYQTAIEKIKDVYKNIITDNMNDLQREYAIVNYLLGQVVYDGDLITTAQPSPDSGATFGYYYFDHPDIYYTFILGKGICDAYSISFLYLATMANLDSYYYADNLLVHAWNIVKINGNYYQLDLTWADQTPYNYSFINISSKTMTNLHSSVARTSYDAYKYPATDIDMPVEMQQMYYEL